MCMWTQVSGLCKCLLAWPCLQRPLHPVAFDLLLCWRQAVFMLCDAWHLSWLTTSM
jgi:hypothetical protein